MTIPTMTIILPTPTILLQTMTTILHIHCIIHPLFHPTSPENVCIEDSWIMDIDQDLANENKDTSSLSNIKHPMFSDQNNPQANHPNAQCQTAPKQKYTKTYHQKLDGKCSLHLYSAILHTELFHRQDLRQGWECAST